MNNWTLAARKLSNGILPCGRCGGRPRKHWDAYWEYFRGLVLRCPDCGLESLKGYTEENAKILWNNLSAKTHPEPEDYLELLEECCPSVPEFSSADSRCGNHLNIMLNLLTDYGDDDD